MDDRVLMDILERAVGHDKAGLSFDAFSQSPSVSIRYNPYKLPAPEGNNVPWNKYGVILRERPRFVMDPLFHAGCYYVQDSSAMIVGHMVREHLDRFEGLGRPVRVLDLCAAPGGKTTDLAASLRERFGDGFLLKPNVAHIRFGPQERPTEGFSLSFGQLFWSCVSRKASGDRDAAVIETRVQPNTEIVSVLYVSERISSMGSMVSICFMASPPRV